MQLCSEHAGPLTATNGLVIVAYELAGPNWKLSVSDNGIGVPDESIGRLGQTKSGLGTSIVKALAQQLDAKIEVLSSPTGTTVSITHAIFAAGYGAGGDHPSSVRAASRPPK